MAHIRIYVGVAVHDDFEEYRRGLSPRISTNELVKVLDDPDDLSGLTQELTERGLGSYMAQSIVVHVAQSMAIADLEKVE